MMEVTVSVVLKIEVDEEVALDEQAIIDSCVEAVKNAVHLGEMDGFTHPLEHDMSIQVLGVEA